MGAAALLTIYVLVYADVCLGVFYLVQDKPQYSGLFGAILGGGAVFIVTRIQDYFQGREKVERTAKALLFEVLERSWRCHIDFHDPWKKYWNGHEERMTAARLQKFRPAIPVIFPNLSAEIGLLPARTALALLRFYSSLEAWSRDLHYWAKEAHDFDLNKNRTWMRLLVRRSGRTFDPAVQAIEALSDSISDADQIIEDYKNSMPVDRRPHRSILDVLQEDKLEANKLVGTPQL